MWRVDRKTVLVQVLERGLSSKGGYRVDTVLHSLPRPSDVKLFALQLPVQQRCLLKDIAEQVQLKLKAETVQLGQISLGSSPVLARPGPTPCQDIGEGCPVNLLVLEDSVDRSALVGPAGGGTC